MSNNNLEDIITDAVNDSQLPDETPEVVETDEVSDTPTEEPIESSDPAPDAPTEETPAESEDSPAVASPAAKSNQPQDEFERLAGIQQTGIGGRENRIPYSRVKKITEKAVSEVAEAALGRKLNAGEKPVDVVKAYVAKIPELESRVTDYETRLNTVGEFEQVMASEPQRFLQMLSRIPAYKEFFDFVEQAANTLQPGQAAPAASPSQGQTTQPTVPVTDDMPEPNEELPDGTKVYNMDGLKALMAWQAKQVEDRVTRKYEDRYKPIETEWQEQKRIEATLPVIRAQIAEAKTWPLFDDNEAEITRVLQLDPNISLEAAYRKVVFPKLVAERNSMRQNVLQEIKTAPVATSVPARAASKPVPPSAGPRSVEDIIRDSVATLKR